MCFSLLRNRRTVQTVKLTLHHRPKPKSATYRRPFAETNQTARISLQILAMSKSNPEDKQPDQCALNYRRARPDIPLNYPPRLRQSLNQPPRLASQRAPQRRRWEAFYGYSLDSASKKIPRLQIFLKVRFSHKNRALAQ